MMIAASDDNIQDEELALLMQQIRQAFELNEMELRRLEALRSLLCVRRPDASSISHLAKGLIQSQREALGKLMLAIVAADGVITDDEMEAVRKGYVAVGLSI